MDEYEPVTDGAKELRGRLTAEQWAGRAREAKEYALIV